MGEVPESQQSGSPASPHDIRGYLAAIREEHAARQLHLAVSSAHLVRSHGVVLDARAFVRKIRSRQRQLASSAPDVLEAEATPRSASDSNAVPLAQLVHDLKAPLASLSWQAQLLQRSLHKNALDEHSLRAGLEAIVVGASDAVAALEDAHRLIAGTGGSVPRRNGPVDLVVLVRQLAASHGERVVVETVQPTLVIDADRMGLTRVVGNLLDNALKYSPANAQVHIRVAPELTDGRTWASISVQDQGIGIPAADLPFVFESRFQGTNIGSVPGGGLGLASAREIVRAHGGEITIHSREGQGATVQVRLPLMVAGPAVSATDPDGLYEQAQTGMAQRDRLLGIVSHDLRNPLTVIKGQAALIERIARERELSSPETGRLLARSTQIIDQSVNRAIGLINELQDAAQLEAGREFALNRASADLVELVKLVITDLEHSTQHTLRFTAQIEHLVCNYDGPRLRRVLDNLLSNAIKYSPDDTEIEVQVERMADAGGTWAVVTVIDQGRGIPASDLPYVFERFHRARNVVGQVPGTGLGLWGARKIVEAHGGRLTLDSREGVGTTATVRLPLKPDTG